MPNRPPQARKAPSRKVIKLDLASMLEDETLSGARQLSALQTKTDPGSGFNVTPGIALYVDPGSTLIGKPQIQADGPILSDNVDPGIGLPCDSPDGTIAEQAPGAELPIKTDPGLVLPSRCKPIRSVSDGLHPGEAALLHVLWSSGSPDGSNQDVRIVSLGHAAIRRRAGPGRSTIKRLLRSLARKHCIGIRKAATVLTPASYEIFSEGRILADWEHRGWTQVYRDRRAVTIMGPGGAN